MTSRNVTGHQWLSRVDGPVLHTSITEMTSVLHCAGSLARKQGMALTGDRLHNDADRLRAVYDAHPDTPIIIVIPQREDR